MSDALLDYYRQRATEYEKIYIKPERQADLASLKMRLKATFERQHVLEVACGTGYWTAVLAETASSILATDANEAVLEVARSKQLPAEKVSFVQGDAYALEKLPGRFTALFAGFWWSHLPRQETGKFLASVKTLLPPDATVIFVDNRYVEGSNTRINETDIAGNTYQIRHLSDGSAHRVLKNFPSRDELVQAVNGYLDEVNVVELDYFWLLQGKTSAGT